MTNKEIVLAAMREVFEEKDLTAADRYFSDSYVQHNPNVPSGVEGLRAIVPTLDGFKWTAVRAVEEGDFVMTHSRVLGLGPEPMAVADIFRLEDGQIVEHWDVIQAEVPAGDTASGNPMI